MASFSGVAFGVVADARARQHRRRRVLVGGAVVVAALGAALAGYVTAAGGGGGPGPVSPIAVYRAEVSAGESVQLGYGRAAEAFRILAPAGRAYDVTLAVPTGSAATLTVYIGPGAGWTVSTRDTSDCRVGDGRRICLVHFAAGGNPGGTWEALVRKTTMAAVDARVSVVFRRRPGVYHSK